MSAPPLSHSVGTDPDLHDSGILRDDFDRAVTYLGGCLTDNAYGQVLLGWSPRAVKRLGIAARTCSRDSAGHVEPTQYLTYRSIPAEVVLGVFDAWEAALDADRDRQIARTPCRSCRNAGRATLATVAVGQALALCEPCAAALPGLALISAPVERLPIKDMFCKNCYGQLYIGPNLAEQIAAVGRFCRLCPDCWSRRSVTHEEL